MYIPAHFAAADATVDELLTRHGAADLITLTDDGLLATMLPFVYEPSAGEHGALLGHVARNNDQWRKPARGESLAIVRGPMPTCPRPGTRPRPSTAGWSPPGTM
jgi:transcriptional regulator